MSNRAYYSATIEEFKLAEVSFVVGELSRHHPQNIEPLQMGAWIGSIKLLQAALLPFATGHILLEMQIPRMGRRVDAVLILQNIVFVLEFKVGADRFLAADRRQAHGYAIDLHHFHRGSHNKTIVPILVATEAVARALELPLERDSVYAPLSSNGSSLPAVLRFCLNRIEAKEVIDYASWYASAYLPTPTIIEAAEALYADHDVADISRNDAGATNLRVTSKAVHEIIHHARENKRKVICFVTGVPGAGKTLVGLNIANSSAKIEKEEHAVFLSGNGPLVEVLSEALARDRVRRQPGTTKVLALREAGARIQNIHKFRDEALHDPLLAPPDRVVIFDEAQRCQQRSKTDTVFLVPAI